MSMETSMVLCPKCRLPTPVTELNADDECSTCAALRSLRTTLIERGKIHPNLFEKQDNRQLPPGDRE